MLGSIQRFASKATRERDPLEPVNGRDGIVSAHSRALACRGNPQRAGRTLAAAANPGLAPPAASTGAPRGKVPPQASGERKHVSRGARQFSLRPVSPSLGGISDASATLWSKISGTSRRGGGGSLNLGRPNLWHECF